VDADGVGDREADGEDVAACDGDGTTTDGGALVPGGLAAGGTLGDTLVAPAVAVTAALAVAVALRDLVSSAGPGVRDMPSARTMITPVAAMAIRIADAAAPPGSASIRPLGCLTCSGKPLMPNGPARCVTSSRYACAGGLSSPHSASTLSRSPRGSTASGAMPSSTAGRSALRLRYAQAAHWPVCRATCLRTGAVSCPSQSYSIRSSVGQAHRPVRATSSTPNSRSSRPRARDAKA
jgi:hypothetical protein